MLCNGQSRDDSWGEAKKMTRFFKVAMLVLATATVLMAAPVSRGVPTQQVPEPATLALMGSGLAAMGAWLRGKRR